jgi:hypothetical protein
MRVQMKSLSLAAAAAAVMMISGCGLLDGRTAADADQQWIPLFNGKNLDGWIPKFTGSELGVNYRNTFQAQKGVLKVVYDQYDTFDEQFGHLFYKTPYSHYRMRLEYRFLGQQTPGGPDWAYRNSGVMIHCQDPTTMRKDQEFPVCIEVQLLGGDGKTPRPTGNLCTPAPMS